MSKSFRQYSRVSVGTTSPTLANPALESSLSFLAFLLLGFLGMMLKELSASCSRLDLNKWAWFRLLTQHIFTLKFQTLKAWHQDLANSQFQSEIGHFQQWDTVILCENIFVHLDENKPNYSISCTVGACVRMLTRRTFSRRWKVELVPGVVSSHPRPNWAWNLISYTAVRVRILACEQLWGWRDY